MDRTGTRLGIWLEYFGWSPIGIPWGEFVNLHQQPTIRHLVDLLKISGLQMILERESLIKVVRLRTKLLHSWFLFLASGARFLLYLQRA
eukprot:09248_6